MRHTIPVALMTLALPMGCQFGDSPDQDAAPRPSQTSRQSPTPKPATAAGVRLPLNVGPVAFNGTVVAYPVSSPAGYWNRVAIINLSTGAQRAGIRTAFDDGFINWVALADGWIGWVDQSARQSDAAPAVLWRVWAMNLSTGERRLLGSNHRRPDPYVPQILGRDRYFYWTAAEPDRSARESAWQVGGGAVFDVLRHTEMTPGSETLDGHRLVYLSRAAAAGGGYTIGGDCWWTGLHGGSPRPLTRTALAMGCAESGARLVWLEHIAPDEKPMPEDGLLDDPFKIWTQLGSAKPVLVHRGYSSSRYPIAGRRFVVWQRLDGALMVTRLTHQGHTTRVVAKRVSSFASDGGNQVAMIIKGKHTSLRIVDLES